MIGLDLNDGAPNAIEEKGCPDEVGRDGVDRSIEEFASKTGWRGHPVLDALTRDGLQSPLRLWR
jgi:hypothetical protein